MVMWNWSSETLKSGAIYILKKVVPSFETRKLALAAWNITGGPVVCQWTQLPIIFICLIWYTTMTWNYQYQWRWHSQLQFMKPTNVNSSAPGQNGHYFADDLFKRIFLNENVRNVQISLKFVRKGPIDNKSAVVQVMAWHRTKPLPELILTQFIDAYMWH